MIENEQAFYYGYVFIFETPFSLKKKNLLFTALMAGEPWGWRVVGISEAALEELAKHEFKYVKGLFCRSHFTARIETSREVFERRISKDQFFERFLKTDVTAITLKSENTKNGPEKFLPIDSERKLFPSQQVGWRHGPEERAYLKEMHAAYKVGRLAPKLRSDIIGVLDT